LFDLVFVCCFCTIISNDPGSIPDSDPMLRSVIVFAQCLTMSCSGLPFCDLTLNLASFFGDGLKLRNRFQLSRTERIRDPFKKCGVVTWPFRPFSGFSSRFLFVGCPFPKKTALKSWPKSDGPSLFSEHRNPRE